MATKTPKEVSDAIKKLDAVDQVAIQTYLAKLKQTIADLDESQHAAIEVDAGHAHYHGHEKCTHDHGHDDHHEEKHETHGHEHSQGHEHSHDHHKDTHKECHDPHHDHKEHDDDTPEWKKKAMDADPNACPFGGSWNAESTADATKEEDGDLPPLYEGTNDDFETASDLKMQASDFKSSGKLEEALEKYTAAILAAQPSALLYANRADVLSKLKRAKHAIRDCDEALKINPDSAKALRIRGIAKKSLEMYEEALKDLSQAQAIDYDDNVVEHLKLCMEKRKEFDKITADKRNKEEQRLRKKAEEIKKAREEAAKEEKERSAPPMGMPGMGGQGMPGMGGMPGGMGGLMQAMMSDPELAEGMKNPKVMAAFSEIMSAPGGPMGLMSNPAKLQELMGDEEVGPFMRKIMTKLGPMMGGGIPGMPGGFGGMPGAAPAGGDDMDMPDIPDMGNDDDDIPNLD